jgi:cytochrome c oxidase subunit II
MSPRVSRLALALGVTVAAAAIAGCGASAATPRVSGEALFGACVACHGEQGEGNRMIGAPRIAGMPQWYVAEQLDRFQTGLRGQHPDDVEGLKMRAMSKQMLNEDEVTSVAAYVESLPKITNPATLDHGDPTTGQTVFVVCTACHGADGHGNEQVKAPPLAGQDDWYVARELRKFRSRVRGTAPNDPVGPIMQAMSMTIDPANIDHLAAYVHSLPR